MTRHRVSIAVTLFVSAAPLASAGPLFTFLSAERHVKGIADCGPHVDPPVVDDRRIDAEGFEYFLADLEVSIISLPDCLVSGRVIQSSRFLEVGLTASGSAEANLGLQPGNYAMTGSFYHAEFQVSQTIDVPVYLRATQARDNDLRFTDIELTGPGVSVSLGDGTGVQEFLFDDLVTFQAGQTYSFTFDIDAGEGESRILYETHIFLPAPGTAAPLLAVAVLPFRRRRATAMEPGRDG